MKQRVAIARVLINNPRVLLMDEPFAALDAQTRLMMQERLLALWEEQNMSMLFITHDIDEAILDRGPNPRDGRQAGPHHPGSGGAARATTVALRADVGRIHGDERKTCMEAIAEQSNKAFAN